MPPSGPVTLVWFRHDLRLDDNPALTAAAARGRVVPVFIWAPEEEAPWEPVAASRWWLHQSLEKLAAALAKVGAPLVIRRGPSLATLEGLAKEYAATHVAWNRRYEPAVVKRDTAIKQSLTAAGLAAESFNGGLLFEPVHVATKEGRPYQVFTPFWRTLLARDEPAEPVAAPRKLAAAEPVKGKATTVAVGDLDLLPEIDWAGTMRKTWSPGEAGAAKRLDTFLGKALATYGTERDRPDHEGTSALSPHLHFGEISPRQVWHVAAKWRGSQFMAEIGWREFAHHLLYHFPHTTDAPLRADFARFPWREDAAQRRAWQRGLTGVPLVDAGMRELWHTGWMHNRVRMVVGSFLVKNLRLHWLEGARWFWDTLVDADLASNTLGWQWCAGCGADAAPYFRVFNPESQAAKFDPEGAYQRHWVPEYAAETGGGTRGAYPLPIVDLKASRVAALEAFASLRK